MQVDSKVIGSLFPKYLDLFESEIDRPNDQLEYFIKEQLPDMIKILQNFESTFTRLLHSHSTLILKKQSSDTLFQSFLRKVSEKVQKYFNGLDDHANKASQQSEMFEFGRIRTDFRGEMEPLIELITRKLPSKGRNTLDRVKEQEIVQSLYTIIEYYQWTKSDSAAISSKFRISPPAVLQQIKNGMTTGDPSSIVSIDASFRDTVADYVNKKCRPFLQKRDFLISKIKELCRETEGRMTSFQPKQYLKSIISRERVRCDRDIVISLQHNIRSNPLSKHYEKEVPEINQEMTQIQNDFHKLKNNSYYLDIIRGNFIDTYQMQTKKLENVFAMGRLEKYLQQVYSLVERMKDLLNRIIDNRKGEKLQLQDAMERIVDGSINELQGSFQKGLSLSELMMDEIVRLKELLDTVPDSDDHSTISNGADKFKQEQQNREREREARIGAERERREEQQRQKKEDVLTRAEKQKQSRQQRRIRQEQRKAKQQQDRLRRDEQRKLDDVERQKRMQQQKRQRQQKKQIQGEQLKAKAEQDRIKRQRQIEERQRKMEETKQRQSQDQRKRKQQQQERKRKKQQQKRQAEQARKKAELEVEEKRKRDQQGKARLIEEQKQKKLEKERQQKERLRQTQEEKRKQKQSQEQRRREEQEEKARRAQEQKRLRQEKLAEDKRNEEERKKAEQIRIQREKEEAAKKQQQRLEREAQEKRQREDEKRQREQRERQEKLRIQREKEEAQMRQKQRKQNQKKRLEQQKRDREDRQRQEAEQLRKQKQTEVKRKEEQRKEKQRLEQVRLQNERKQKERKEEQRKEQERKQKERKQQQKKQLQKRQKDRVEAERLEKERKQQEKAELKRQEEQAKKQPQKQPAKPSAIVKKDSKNVKSSVNDYSDMYDDDDIVDEDELNLPAKKPVPGAASKQPVTASAKPGQKGKAASKDEDFEFLNNPDDNVDFGLDDNKDKAQYAEDFQEGEHQQSQGQSNIETKELMSVDNIKLFNDYLKGTQYARKNKLNLQPFNNHSHFMAMFEEFVQNREIYIFDDEITKEIFDMPAEMDDAEVFQQHINEVNRAMTESYHANLQLVEFDLETRYFFPVLCPNALQIRIVEFCPIVKEFTLFVNEPLSDSEEAHEFLEKLLEIFGYLFGVNEAEESEEMAPQLQTIVLTKQNQTIIDTFDKHLPALLILFNYLYEYKNRSGLVIDQYTIERFFYCSHSMENIYKAIELEQDALTNHFDKLREKFASDKNITTMLREYDLADPQFTQRLIVEFKQDRDNFIKGQVNTVLTLISLDQTDQQENFVMKRAIYTEMTKASPKPILNLYLFETDRDSSDFNQNIFSRLMSQEDPRFDVAVYLDFTRHNMLYEFSNLSLPLWAHVMIKKKMKAADALAVINLSMLPIYACYKNQD